MRRVRRIRKILDLFDQIAHADFQRFGDFQQGCERSFHVPPFNLANEIVMQISLLGQLFLRQASLFTICTNFLPQHATMIWLGHLSSQKHEELNLSTQHNVFCVCQIGGMGIKPISVRVSPVAARKILPRNSEGNGHK